MTACRVSRYGIIPKNQKDGAGTNAGKSVLHRPGHWAGLQRACSEPGIGDTAVQKGHLRMGHRGWRVSFRTRAGMKASIAALAGALALAAPQGAAAETLREALNAAYKFNPRLDAARAL